MSPTEDIPLLDELHRFVKCARTNGATADEQSRLLVTVIQTMVDAIVGLRARVRALEGDGETVVLQATEEAS